MQKLGYAKLIDQFGLPVILNSQPATVSTAVNRRVDTDTEILFPVGVAHEDAPLGHLEFALRHEGINLALIAAAFEHISPEAIIHRLTATPNGEYIRRLAFLWEWLHDSTLDAGIQVSARTLSYFLRSDMSPPARPSVTGNSE